MNKYCVGVIISKGSQMTVRGCEIYANSSDEAIKKAIEQCQSENPGAKVWSQKTPIGNYVDITQYGDNSTEKSMEFIKAYSAQIEILRRLIQGM